MTISLVNLYQALYDRCGIKTSFNTISGLNKQVFSFMEYFEVVFLNETISYSEDWWQICIVIQNNK